MCLIVKGSGNRCAEGCPRPRSFRARGVAIVQVAVLLVVLLGMAAMSVDVGFIYNSRAEMQVAVDAAALAGASGLVDGAGVPEWRARDYAARHVVAGEPVSEAADMHVSVTVGNWEGLAGDFFPADEDEFVTPNAVHVDGRRDNLPLYFARALGIDSSDVQRDAVAVLDGGRCLGIWGLQGVFGDGDIYTDSYDSRNGAYGGGNVHPNGDICSGQQIELSGSVEIFGDAMYGPGYSLLTDGHPKVWGVVAQLCCPLEPPVVDYAKAESNNDNDTIGLTDRGRDPFGGDPWNLVVTGNDNLTLAGGTYYFTSALVDGRATLTVTGPTTIFLTGPAEFTGNGLVNLSQNPNDLVIYSNGSTMALRGTAGFYGVVVAPETDVSLVGTGDYYGMIVGKTLDMDGTANVHVDEAAVFEILGQQSVATVLVK